MPLLTVTLFIYFYDWLPLIYKKEYSSNYRSQMEFFRNKQLRDMSYVYVIEVKNIAIRQDEKAALWKAGIHKSFFIFFFMKALRQHTQNLPTG